MMLSGVFCREKSLELDVRPTVLLYSELTIMTKSEKDKN